MARRDHDRRPRLVDAATVLVHQQGFRQTTLADVARHAEVPLGNMYYYFPTKEALGEVVVDQHLAAHRSLRARWDGEFDPKARILAFVAMSVEDRETLATSGCPVGTLCAEVSKQGGPLAQRAAGIFAEWLTWLETQFRALGDQAEAPDRALHVLSALQGAALLAHTFDDASFVVREAARLSDWIGAR